MKVYIDSDFKCHTTPSEGYTAIETDFFDGKSPDYIEGFRYVPDGMSWTREDGTVFTGEMMSAWTPWEELDAVQRAYERTRNEELTAAMAEMVEEVYRRDMEEME